MKKLLCLLLFVPVLAFGQINNNDFNYGITHNIADQYLSAADSMHYIGTFRLVDGTGLMYDSLGMNICANDSLAATVYGVLRYPLTPAYSAGTVPADTVDIKGLDIESYALPVSVNTTVSAVKYQNVAFTAAGLNVPAQAIDIWVRVYAVGSEVASSNKKFTVQMYGHRRK